MTTDRELLHEYAANGSEDAFRDLVLRHLGLVKGVALRQLGSPSQADEVCQAVFVALARKAASLPQSTVVAGWLFRAARFAAAKLARDEGRRSRREKEAAMNHAELNTDQDYESVWGEIAPHLDQALESLRQKDRDALLLRFFENRPFSEVGKDLGVSEDAAKMRVSRALGKMRGFFRKRQVVLAVSALMGAFSAKATEVLPSTFVNSVASNALKGSQGAAYGSQLAHLILRHFYLVRLKRELVVLSTILVLGTATTIAVYRFGPSPRQVNRPEWPPRNLPAQQWPGR